MQLHAVIVPPSEVVEDALEAARALIPAPPPPVDGPKAGIVAKLLGRRPPAAPVTPAVSLVPTAVDEVFLRLSKFGNVTGDDAAGLAKALEAVAGTWRVPVLHVSTLAVAQAGPFDVTARLGGDLDDLQAVFRNVNEVARLERFFLDRRSFRSELSLGVLDSEDGAPLPEDAAGVELPHRGPRWSPSHITLLRASFTAGRTSFAEVARVELGDGAESSGALTGA